jgi:hypothetical protein
MKSVLLVACMVLGQLFCCLSAYAGAVQNIIYVTETGTAFYISVSETDCKNKIAIGHAYKCELVVDPDLKDVTKVKFGGKLKDKYGANTGTILVTDKDGNSDLIKFPADTTVDKVSLALSILFYSYGDDTDTDNSKDTKDKSIFNVTIDGPCDKGDNFNAGKTCSITEKDLTGESDTVNGTDITFDGKTANVPNLTGASGLAFTVSGANKIGSIPGYPNTFIRYIFVSDTCEPKPGKSGAGGEDICALPTPEPPMVGPMGASLVVWLSLVQRRWMRSRLVARP